jgi:hypothetical protein
MAARVTALLSELETALKVIYPTIGFGLGQKALAHQDTAPPRIVWIPTVAKHSAPEKNKTNPRRLITRAPTIVAHCWAFDPAQSDPKKHYDACEDLVSNLLVALHKSTWGSIEMGGEEWLQPDEISHGHAALVTFSVRSPVEDKTYQTVQLTQLQPNIVGSVAGDSNVDWSEP